MKEVQAPAPLWEVRAVGGGQGNGSAVEEVVVPVPLVNDVAPALLGGILV